jgi:hypothetical protein
VIEGHQGVTYFKQVSLMCDHCAIKEVSQEQVDLCKKEFQSLHLHLFKREPIAAVTDQIKIPGPAPIAPIQMTSGEQFRISSSPLKCDVEGGQRYRIDILVK